MRARPRHATGLFVAFLLSLNDCGNSGASATSDPTRHTLAAARAVTPPVIDGRLDDPAWLAASPDDRFIQEQPLEKQAPTERTEMRVSYDDDALYVAFECHDSRPRAVVARPTRRDREIE